MKEKTGVKDMKGKEILEGDVLEDVVPSKGIVMMCGGIYVVSTDFEGEDIRNIEMSDDLVESLITNNQMVVIGNIHDTPNLV